MVFDELFICGLKFSGPHHSVSSEIEFPNYFIKNVQEIRTYQRNIRENYEFSIQNAPFITY